MKNPPNWPAEKQSRKRPQADAKRVPPSSVLSLGLSSLAASNPKFYIPSICECWPGPENDRFPTVVPTE